MCLLDGKIGTPTQGLLGQAVRGSDCEIFANLRLKL